MKQSIYFLAVIASLMVSGILTSCQSTAEKADKAQDKVENVKQDLKEAEKDANIAAQKAATAEEWKMFKDETEVKIKNNETRIAELKAKMKTSGKTLDAVYSKNIEALEQRNRDLKARLDTYEKNQSDWESFKREFNHDMDALGQALKEFSTNNKK